MGKKKDFRIYNGLGEILNEEYDFLSIMHYSPYAKSKNDEKTIKPKVSAHLLVYLFIYPVNFLYARNISYIFVCNKYS